MNPASFLACLCAFLASPNHEREKQTLDFNRLSSSTPALFWGEPAAKSQSMLNNSITAVQNTHSTLLKPGHFRGEEFIDFKLLPLGPSPLISEEEEEEKKNNKPASQSAACVAPRWILRDVCWDEVGEEELWVTVAQWDASVQMLARTLMLIAHQWKDFIRQCGFC